MYRQPVTISSPYTDHGKTYRPETCPNDSGFLTLGGIEVGRVSAWRPLLPLWLHIGTQLRHPTEWNLRTDLHDLVEQKAMVIMAIPIGAAMTSAMSSGSRSTPSNLQPSLRLA
jgi:hypothetical protein